MYYEKRVGCTGMYLDAPGGNDQVIRISDFAACPGNHGFFFRKQPFEKKTELTRLPRLIPDLFLSRRFRYLILPPSNQRPFQDVLGCTRMY